MNAIISNFLRERKDDWLKKKLKGNVSEEEKSQLVQEAREKYSLATWLPDAAKRASQLSMASHPSKFSHPSAKTSSIIANANKNNDGYLRTGNVDYSLDVFGNAAAMDVYKFLSLTLEDGQTILQHLEQHTSDIQAAFSIPTVDFVTLKEGLLSVKQNDPSQVTDGLVKQIYFPCENNYHLLSVLTPSGLLSRIKKQLYEIRFSETAKEAREFRRSNRHHLQGYDELFALTETAYGGTKPQNISVLNSQNGGVSYLLDSSPPSVKRRNIRLPKRDFFVNTLRVTAFTESFYSLHGLMSKDYNNNNIRSAMTNIINYIIGGIFAYSALVRNFEVGWSTVEYYKDLPLAQRIWLDNVHIEKRKKEEEWLSVITISIARWVITAYEKTMKKSHITLGDGELIHIEGLVREAINKDKEYLQ